MLQYHIKCDRGDVGKFVFLPGDPSRAENIAQHFDSYEKVAQNREFTTYTGKIGKKKVSVTSTGIGCPSAAIALEELSKIGAQYFIRIGTTGAIQPHIKINDCIIASGAVRCDGTTPNYVRAEYPAISSLNLTNALIESAEDLGVNYHVGLVCTSDSFYREDELLDELSKVGVLSVEMECSAILTLASLKGLHAAAILAVNGNRARGLIMQDARLGVENAIKTAVEAIRRI